MWVRAKPKAGDMIDIHALMPLQGKSMKKIWLENPETDFHE